MIKLRTWTQKDYLELSMWTKEITKVVKEGGKNIRVRETDMTKEIEDRERERLKDVTLLEPAAKECRKLLEENGSFSRASKRQNAVC